MRINKFLAQATGMSRRAADDAVTAGTVAINDQPVQPGQGVIDTDVVAFRGKQYTLADIAAITPVTVMLNKPTSYVVSRNGQGSMTVYDLLPAYYQQLKPIGRLDKESSGLLLLTNDGELAHELTHPSRHKIKRYEVTLNKPLQPLHRQMISEFGLQLEDGLSKLLLDRIEQDDLHWLITMHEGRNRQIRRTFESLGYAVTRLHRTQFGDYLLNDLPLGEHHKL